MLSFVQIPMHTMLVNIFFLQIYFLPDPRGAGLHLAFQFSYLRTDQAKFVSFDLIFLPTQSLRDKGTEGQRDKGTKGKMGQRDKGTKELWNFGTWALGTLGTWELGNLGT